MNLYDIINLSIIGGAFFLGVYRGFLISLVHIFSFALFITLTIILFPLTGDIVDEYIKNTYANNTASFIFSVFLSRFSTNWIKKNLIEIFEKISGSFIDRILGIWLGLLNGLLMVSIIFLSVISITIIIKSTPKNYWELLSYNENNTKIFPKWLKSSSSYIYLDSSHEITSSLLDNNFISNFLKNNKISKKPPAEKDSSNIEDQLMDQVHDVI